jgi:hypothetical protein
MARFSKKTTEPPPVVTITRASLTTSLAESFRSGTSAIEMPQVHPPPVGLGIQVGAKEGKKNWLPRTAEQEQRNELATECKANKKDPVTMWKRNHYGAPTMEPNKVLPTLEGLVARAYCNKLSEGGGEAGNARFATMRQANAVNRAFTQRSRGDRILSPSAQGIGLQLKNPPPDTRTIGQQDLKVEGVVQRDSNNQPVRETIEKPLAKGAKPREASLKVIYNTDEFVFDTAPERVDRVDSSDRGKVYDDKGQQLDLSGGTKGKVLYNDKGEHAYKNYDEDGKSVPPRIGDVRRTQDGEPIMRSVARTGRSPQELTTVDEAITSVNQALGDQATRRVKGLNTEVTIVHSENAKVKDLNLALKERDPADPGSKNQVTLTIPAKFADKNQELATLSRASAHLEQVTDTANPNYKNAAKAATMTPANRAKSSEFASAELVAQHAAMNNVTRAGEEWKPMPKAHNEKMRENWAAQISTDSGLQNFSDATDRCSRVVSGKQPTMDLDQVRDVQLRQENAARTRAEGKEKAQERTQEPVGARPTMDWGSMAAAGPTRGEGQEAGGAEPPKGQAPARADKKKGDGDPTGSGKR